MRSGRKIFEMLEENPRGRVDTIRALGNGDLRSLLAYAGKGRRTYAETTEGEMITALAMVEGIARWMAKGKGKSL